VLIAKGLHEVGYIEEVCREYSMRTVLAPWIGEELAGETNLGKLKEQKN